MSQLADDLRAAPPMLSDERLKEMLVELVGGRVETGPLRFGDDWCGIFIRGDDAAHKAMTIGMAATHVPDPLASMVLVGTSKLLATCREPAEDARLVPDLETIASILTELLSLREANAKMAEALRMARPYVEFLADDKDTAELDAALALHRGDAKP